MDVRESLLQATVRMFAESGSRGATTRRIAEAAGVNEVTLFRHFQTKEALITAALQWFAQAAPTPMLPDDPSDPPAELLAWGRHHYRQLYEVRSLIRRCMAEFEERPELATPIRRPVQTGAELQAYLQKLRRKGLARGDWDVSAAASMLMGTLFADAMGRDMMPERYPYSLEQAHARYVELFLRAIGVDVPPTAERRKGQDR